MNPFVPKVYHYWFHRWPTRHLDRLMLVHCWMSFLSRVVVAESWSILDIEAKHLSEVVKVGPNDTGAPMAITLAEQRQLAYMSRCCSVSMHDLFMANVVCNEIKTRSNCFYRLKLFVKAILRLEVERVNDRCELESHLNQLGLFRFTFGCKDQRVF